MFNKLIEINKSTSEKNGELNWKSKMNYCIQQIAHFISVNSWESSNKNLININVNKNGTISGCG